jgi:hypothetical protein
MLGCIGFGCDVKITNSLPRASALHDDDCFSMCNLSEGRSGAVATLKSGSDWELFHK